MGQIVPLVRSGFVGATIEYRLTGEAPFPAQIEDCKCAIRYLRAHAEKYNIDPNRIAVGGSSAGGHLVALLGTSGSVKELEGSGGWPDQSSTVQAVVDLYGPTDFAAFVTAKGYESHNLAGSPESKLLGGGEVLPNVEGIKRVNPITYVDEADPPFLIIHGTDDKTVPLNQSEAIHNALEDAKVSSKLHVIEGAGHGGKQFREPKIRAMQANFLTALLLPNSQIEAYDPLTVDKEVTVVDTRFSYGDDKRMVPLRLYLPKSTEATPVILYSHGLGGSRDAGTFVGKHWAGRGYVVVTMQHAGSDKSVMEGIPLRQKLGALKKAANAASAQARYRDVKATLDHLDSLNQPGEKYAARFDLTKVGMGGHSFGAVTTQAVSGQKFGRQGQLHTDKRIDAAVAFSPSPPSFGSASDAFDSVSIPWLLMTGTEDESMLARTTPEKRQEVFQHLPKSGQFYELVLDGAKHEAFADERTNRFRSRSNRNPNHHKAIKALSTAFWDTYLKGDESAKTWLNGRDAKSVLEQSDVWQKK
ncbi:UNVERIFIED_CONTAM: hypothetical protein GTU68_061876 [Idotea baltica]|nr:hypothetical protein [Idotea baltica]